jgi:hypothetical protein
MKRKDSYPDHEEGLDKDGRQIDNISGRTRRPDDIDVTVNRTEFEFEPGENIPYDQVLLELAQELNAYDEQRANDRYAVYIPFTKHRIEWMSRANRWLEEAGRRQMPENFDQIGNYKKAERSRKYLKPVLKVATGVGAAAAMVVAGVPVVAPTVFMSGLKQAYDGVIEAIQKGGWAEGWQSKEQTVQARVDDLFEQAKTEIHDAQNPLTTDRFNALMTGIKEAHNEVLTRQNLNTKSETNHRRFRAVASSVAAIGSGLISGIPMGRMDVDGGSTKVPFKGEMVEVLKDTTHRTMLRLGESGFNWEFMYNKGSEAVNAAIQAGQRGMELTQLEHYNELLRSLYGQFHTMGGKMVSEAWIGLGTAAAAMTATVLEQWRGRTLKNLNKEVEITQKKPEFGSLYGHLDADAKNELKARRSETLAENPQAILNFVKERDAYLEKQTPAYTAELYALSASVSPMKPETEIVINIPAAADQEADRITHTLEQYVNQVDKNGQPFNPNRFEINILANFTEKSDPAEVAKFFTAIRKFKTEYPELLVNVISKQFGSSEINMGLIRKILGDLVLLRSQEAGIKKDSIMVSNDADVVAISDRYLDTYVNEFANPENVYIGGIMGKMDWDPYLLEANPLFAASIRAMEYANIYRAHKQEHTTRRNVNSSGPNFAYRSSLYAAVGGYNPDVRGAGEDNYLGEAIYFARQIDEEHGIPTLGKGNKGTALYTSGRRAAAAFLAGSSPGDMWSIPESVFKMSKDAIRNISDIALINKIRDPQLTEGLKNNNPTVIEQFDRKIEKSINDTLGSYYDLPAKNLGNELMRFLGVKGEIVNGKVKVHSTEKLRSDLLKSTSTAKGYAKDLLARNYASTKQPENIETINEIVLDEMQPGDEYFTEDTDSRVFIDNGSYRVEIGTVSRQADGSYFVLGLDGNSVKDIGGNIIDSLSVDQLIVEPR